MDLSEIDQLRAKLHGRLSHYELKAVLREVDRWYVDNGARMVALLKQYAAQHADIKAAAQAATSAYQDSGYDQYREGYSDALDMVTGIIDPLRGVAEVSEELGLYEAERGGENV